MATPCEKLSKKLTKATKETVRSESEDLFSASKVYLPSAKLRLEDL